MDYQAECTEILSRLGNGFLRIPNTWFIILMRDEGAKHADGGIYKAVHPSFWKFLIVLWHEVMWPRKGKTGLSATLSLRQFGIRPKDAGMWANALVAGGLFSVQKGDFSSREASTYIYNNQADSVMWQGFYRGLMMAYAEWRSVNKYWLRKHGGERVTNWSKLVSIRVEEETAALRKELGIVAQALPSGSNPA